MKCRILVRCEMFNLVEEYVIRFIFLRQVVE